ncbi:MAG: hypothetical protein IPJ77_13960 [Planctomycetes bacterium]|nr:hypothetical protein [Planctomycetota bacterium]
MVPPELPKDAEATELRPGLAEFIAKLGSGEKNRLQLQGETPEQYYDYCKKSNALLTFGEGCLAYRLARGGRSFGPMEPQELVDSLERRCKHLGLSLSDSQEQLVRAILARFHARFQEEYIALHDAQGLRFPPSRKFSDMLPYFDQELQFWRLLDATVTTISPESDLRAAIDAPSGTSALFCLDTFVMPTDGAHPR